MDASASDEPEGAAHSSEAGSDVSSTSDGPEDAATGSEAGSDATDETDGPIVDASPGQWLVYLVHDCPPESLHCNQVRPLGSTLFGARFYAQTSGPPVMVSEPPGPVVVDRPRGARFSPDGKLYHYRTGKDAVVVDMTGDVPGSRRHVPQPHETEWIGGFFYDRWTVQSKISYTYLAGEGQRRSVFVLEPDGTTAPVNVTGALGIDITLGNFGSWSPTLPILVVLTERYADAQADPMLSELHTIKVNGSVPEPPVKLGVTGRLWAEWAPDGKRFSIFSLPPIDSPENHSIRVADATTGAVGAATTQGLTDLPDFYPSVDWSPDGRWFTYAPAPYAYTRELYLARVDGTSVTQVTQLPFAGYWRQLYDVLAWAPDSSKLVFSAVEDKPCGPKPDCESGTLYVVDLTGSTPSAPAPIVPPTIPFSVAIRGGVGIRWLPGSSAVAVVGGPWIGVNSDRAYVDENIYLVDPRNTAATYTKVTDHRSLSPGVHQLEYMQVARDRKRIAYGLSDRASIYGPRTTFRHFVLDLESGSPSVRIAGLPEAMPYPTSVVREHGRSDNAVNWSRDGSWIAWFYNDVSARGVYVANVTTASPQAFALTQLPVGQVVELAHWQP